MIEACYVIRIQSLQHPNRGVSVARRLRSLWARLAVAAARIPGRTGGVVPPSSAVRPHGDCRRTRLCQRFESTETRGTG